MDEFGPTGDTMICTRCGCDTYVPPPDTTGLSVSMIKTLCENWMCNDCLDIEERELIECASGKR